MDFIKISHDIKDEILCRENIMKKIRSNIKISKDERIWLTTHSLYNQKWDFIAYNSVVEHINSNEWYSFKIQIESINYDERIVPILSVPATKGSILTDSSMKNIHGGNSLKQNAKVLGIEFDVASLPITANVDYFSKLGLFSIAYECDYYDKKQNIHMRQSSSTGHPDFAILREALDEDTIRYYCKNPTDMFNFDALIFNIKKVKS